MPSSASRAIPDPHAAPPLALSDDLLEEIFLRIASPTDLTRASVACVTFRRLITDPSFLRRYRSLHQPLLLGFLSPLAGFQRATAAHPSARAARVFASAANFNFDDYLPSGRGRRWYPSDVCDGRVLLESFSFDNLMDADLAVCDPLSRHYRLLPPVPTGVQIQEQNGLDFEFEAFLALCAEKDDETTFRVIFQAYCEEKIVVFVFSSGSGSWSVGASTSWDESGLPECSMESLGNRLYAYGCFYWKMDRVNKLLMLDLSRMMFSIADLPPDHEERSIVMVEAGEGRLGMLSYIDNASMTHLFYTTMQNEGGRNSQWQVENRIPLPVAYRRYNIFAYKGCIILYGTPIQGDTPPPACFSLDISNLKIEKASLELKCFLGRLYFGFPPSISPRRI